MIPIQELLSRIRWDPDFSTGTFQIAYYDRVLDGLVRVPFQSVHFPVDTHYSFELVDDQGAVHTIPLHRIREVYRNGERIWSRPPPHGR